MAFCINLVGLLFWLQFHLALILGFASMAAIQSTILCYPVLLYMSAQSPRAAHIAALTNEVGTL